MIKKEFSKLNRNVDFMLLGIMILLLGALFNLIVVFSNDCKMPVLLNYNYETEKHFSFSDNSEVNYHQLSDKYSIGKLMFSIGDVLVIFGFFFFVVSGVLYKKVFYKIIKEDLK